MAKKLIKLNSTAVNRVKEGAAAGMLAGIVPGFVDPMAAAGFAAAGAGIGAGAAMVKNAVEAAKGRKAARHGALRSEQFDK